MKFQILALIISLAFFTACNGEKPSTENSSTENSRAENDTTTVNTAGLPLNKIKLPDGFKISVFAEVENARSLAMSPDGTIFIGNRGEDKVYAVRDTDGDWVADEKFVLAEGLTMPNGVAFKDGDLYVAEVSKIHRFEDIENNLEDPKSEVIYDEYPTDGHHGWKYIAFGPDGKLYVPVGAPCNICLSEKDIYATITRINDDGTGMEIYAEGIRNTVGFDWHPDTKELWFTDNGRDMMGDNIPPDELNKAPEKGMHFGYPFCHKGDIKDPEFGDQRDCSEFVPAEQALGPHVAALGMKFYTGDMFPEKYHKQIFIAEHGSWNRSEKIGYRVMLVTLDDDHKSTGYEVFAEGWLEGESAWGRPVALLNMPDGSLLLSDDHAGVVYRVWYEGGE